MSGIAPYTCCNSCLWFYVCVTLPSSTVKCRPSVHHTLCDSVCRYAWHMVFGEPPVLVAMPECDMLVCDGKGKAL